MSDLSNPMRAPWYQAMTGCLQMIVRDPDDIDIETGEAEHGELRERPFATLLKVLSAEQRLSFAWLALADLAVWPQLEPEAAALILDSLDRSMLDGFAPPFVPGLSQVSEAALAIFRVAASLTRDDRAPADDLRTIIHSCARLSGDRAIYWEQFLRRVVPQAVQIPWGEAVHLARTALQSPITTAGWGWDYSSTQYGPEDGCLVGVAARGSPLLAMQIARFEPYRLTARHLRTVLHPLVPIDLYRMGYLFQTTFLEDALGHVEQGAYDIAVCHNAATGASWTSHGL